MQTVAVVFPGQGSQSVGMLNDIATAYPTVRAPFETASRILGYDLWALVQQGPQATLDQTIHTQPALLVASYAIWQIIQPGFTVQPRFLAGHSLGEYTALLCSDAITFHDAIRLVAARAEYMQAAVPAEVGAMAAIIGLAEETVREICQRLSTETEIVAPANYNSVGQVVIAGHRQRVEQAMQQAKESGAKLTLLLPVSVPSHCQLMLPAAKRLAALLDTMTLQSPRIPVINNVDVQPYQDAASIKDGLVRQLFMPVRWTETIQFFVSQGITQIIECGPGKVLSGLTKRIDKNLQMIPTTSSANLALLQPGLSS